MSEWERFRTYTVRVMRTPGVALDADTRERLDGALSDAEDVINDALPEDYYCKIEESGEGVDLAAVRGLEALAERNLVPEQKHV